MPISDLETRVSELLPAGEQGLYELARSIDEKDLYTYGHSERVCQYALALGRSAGLDEDRLSLLAKAALLHDLGKVEVPTAILRKPSRLTEDEFRQVAQHPARAADVIGQHEAYAEVASVVRHHHERVDGTGYPDGLRGAEMPAESRILAVVDAYDAMVSNRPYRRSMSTDDALEQLRGGVGTQFDPLYTAAFVSIVRDRQLLRAGRLGASSLFAEVSIRDYERAVGSLDRLSLDDEEVSIGGLSDLLSMQYPELGGEQAAKIIHAMLFPSFVRDDLYSDDVDWVKDDEVHVRFPARIDADVCSIVAFEGLLYTIVDLTELADGRFEYRLKR